MYPTSVEVFFRHHNKRQHQTKEWEQNELPGVSKTLGLQAQNRAANFSMILSICWASPGRVKRDKNILKKKMLSEMKKKKKETRKNLRASSNSTPLKSINSK